jgi:tetratricopeptide (TPR) repeat protein
MIFISYRRSDTPHLAIRIYEKLVEQFGPSTVFIDTESIEYGDDFPSAIRKSLSECLVFLPIIGKQWLTAKNESHEERLQLPSDYVRIEIATALALKLAIIPVLDQDVSMPQKESLPDDLRDLSFKHAIPIQKTDDINRLIQTIQKKLPTHSKVQTPGKKRFSSFRNGLIVILLIIAICAGLYMMVLAPKITTLIDNGRLFMNIGLYSQAAPYFQRARQLNPLSTEAKKGFALIALYQKCSSEKLPRNEAIQCIKDFQRQYPNSAHACILLGDMFVNMDTDKAMTYYQQAISIDPQIPELHFSMGYLYAASLKDYHKASMAYEQAIARLKQIRPDMDSIRYLTNLASVYAKLEQTDKSISYYKKAIACEPDALVTYIRLIEILRLSGQKNLAMRYSQDLLTRLNAPAPFSKPINCQPWSFEGFDAQQHPISIQIQNKDEKQYYCLLNICLTSYVCDKVSKVDAILAQADTIQSIDKQTMLSLIYSDVIRLAIKQMISPQAISGMMNHVIGMRIQSFHRSK